MDSYKASKTKPSVGVGNGNGIVPASILAWLTWFAGFLPVHFKNNAELYARQFWMLRSQNPRLQDCTPESVICALMKAHDLGLDPAPELGQCSLIPTFDSRRNIIEARFQINTKGMINLAYRSSNLVRITADIVYEGDSFHYTKGTNAVLAHIEGDGLERTERDRDKITHVYALAEMKGGSYIFEVWPVKKVHDFARGSNNALWKSDFESMARKTLIKALCKYLPLNERAKLDEKESTCQSALLTKGSIVEDVSNAKREAI